MPLTLFTQHDKLADSDTQLKIINEQSGISSFDEKP